MEKVNIIFVMSACMAASPLAMAWSSGSSKTPVAHAPSGYAYEAIAKARVVPDRPASTVLVADAAEDVNDVPDDSTIDDWQQSGLRVTNDELDMAILGQSFPAYPVVT